MNIAFHTLGCKVNQYETEALRELFAAAGHTPVPDGAPFDAAVINSCTVTAESDRKTRQAVRRFRKENPNAVIILTGCMAQAFPEKARALSEADVVAGNTELKRIVEYAEKAAAGGERIFLVEPHLKNEPFSTPPLSAFAGRTRAYMKIEDGCERFCTYCIIPKARGFVRSKPLGAIKEEAERLGAAGFSEIVLAGINLSAYGADLNANLCDAVEAAAAAGGIKRVRLGSLEPEHMSAEMLSRLAANEKFCPHFHLSLQSGCDATLRRMNRHYGTAFYRELVDRIRRMFTDAAVTTDIMVGFPGETEEEFGRSLDFVKEIGFAKAHIFAYSRRGGTIAAALPGQISNAEKAERSRLMSEVTKKSEYEFLKQLKGRILPVLFETSQDGFAEGYTANYSRVKAKADKPHTGEILNVRIISAEKDFCTGEIIL